ncbi:uncharacterized protein G2W53_039434 [Senna tora]|uniref:Uncharacterized protein n=1 Tax=Senna tora TaxID=362788 RepID=A0A834W3K0_9FABA|nr:uncharacterized protein G2W53_039434 [Senna tora]
MSFFWKTHTKKDTGEFIDKRLADIVVTTQSSSWFHPNIEQEIERCVAGANEDSNAAIKQLQENYRKEIDELKKLIISSRNHQEQDDDQASE